MSCHNVVFVKNVSFIKYWYEMKGLDDIISNIYIFMCILWTNSMKCRFN